MCRVGEGGEVSGETWDNAPNVVSESIQRSLSRGGEGGECVMVREGELVNAVCSMELNYVCLFTYSGELCTCYTSQGHAFIHVYVYI